MVGQKPEEATEQAICRTDWIDWTRGLTFSTLAFFRAGGSLPLACCCKSSPSISTMLRGLLVNLPRTFHCPPSRQECLHPDFVSPRCDCRARMACIRPSTAGMLPHDIVLCSSLLFLSNVGFTTVRVGSIWDGWKSLELRLEKVVVVDEGLAGCSWELDECLMVKLVGEACWLIDMTSISAGAIQVLCLATFKLCCCPSFCHRTPCLRSMNTERRTKTCATGPYNRLSKADPRHPQDLAAVTGQRLGRTPIGQPLAAAILPRALL